ncbi:MAG: preprotein translocase subunit SecE [Clostridia bacterium]
MDNEKKLETKPVKKKKPREKGRVKKYFREVVGEVKKLSWPTPKELAMYSLMVLAFVAVMAIIIGALDIGFGEGMRALAHVAPTATPVVSATPVL